MVVALKRVNFMVTAAMQMSVNNTNNNNKLEKIPFTHWSVIFDLALIFLT